MPRWSLPSLGVLLLLSPSLRCVALDNGLARTPALGWSSWNYFENNINESLVEGIAEGMVSSGLQAAGFAFVNLDAGAWAPNRSSTGEILVDEAKFPSGLAALAAKVHGKGLLLGMYTDLSSRTVGKVCGTGPGSFGHFERDAATFARIGIDWLKVDYCAYDQSDPSKFFPPIQTQLAPWQQLRDALNKTGRPIYTYFCPRSFSGSLVPPGNCKPGTRYYCPDPCCIADGPPHEWDGPTRQALANTILTEYSNSKDEWASAMSNLDALLALRPKPDVSGPGFWSDGDMLHTCSFGNGKKGTGMKQSEYDAQYALYAVLASPIIISADLRTLKATHPVCLALLTNSDILAVHQDPKGLAPRLIFEHQANVGGGSVAAQGFAREMADGSTAVVLLNRADHGSATLTATWASLGLKPGVTCRVRDLLGKRDLPNATATLTAVVGSHGAMFVRLSDCE